jgi:hypothetical protein
MAMKIFQTKRNPFFYGYCVNQIKFTEKREEFFSHSIARVEEEIERTFHFSVSTSLIFSEAWKNGICMQLLLESI